jgi:hypothetical protein
MKTIPATTASKKVRLFLTPPQRDPVVVTKKSRSVSHHDAVIPR